MFDVARYVYQSETQCVKGNMQRQLILFVNLIASKCTHTDAKEVFTLLALDMSSYRWSDSLTHVPFKDETNSNTSRNNDTDNKNSNQSDISPPKPTPPLPITSTIITIIVRLAYGVAYMNPAVVSGYNN